MSCGQPTDRPSDRKREGPKVLTHRGRALTTQNDGYYFPKNIQCSVLTRSLKEPTTRHEETGEPQDVLVDDACSVTVCLHVPFLYCR